MKVEDRGSLEGELRALRSKLLIYEKAMSVIADGFIIVGRDGRIMEINQAYCDYFGVKREDTLGRQITEVVPNTHLLDIMENGLVEVDGFHQFQEGQTLSGEKMVAVSRMPVMDGNEVIASAALIKFSGYTITLGEALKNLEQEVDYYRRELRRQGGPPEFADIPCTSESCSMAASQAMRFADSDLPLLLLGETGAGKEVFAQAIHQAGSRKKQPFISVNCAAIPEDLLESELFGYAEGAFTGSRKGGMRGKFELADGGTLLLDEIGDMPLAMQSKLLRVLQTQEVEKLGSEKKVTVDVRILASTNQDLAKRVEEGAFRSDLYYRLNVLTITVPPLRDRVEDIPELARMFVEELCQKYGRRVRLDRSVLFALTAHDWPGNIRELRNVIGRCFMLAEGDVIMPEHLPESVRPHAVSVEEEHPKDRRERRMILESLAVNDGNISRTAKELGIHRATLYHKIQHLGIDMERFRRSLRVRG